MPFRLVMLGSARIARIFTGLMSMGVGIDYGVSYKCIPVSFDLCSYSLSWLSKESEYSTVRFQRLNYNPGESMWLLVCNARAQIQRVTFTQTYSGLYSAFLTKPLICSICNSVEGYQVSYLMKIFLHEPCNVQRK